MKIEQGIWNDLYVEILKKRIAEFPDRSFLAITRLVYAEKNSNGVWVFGKGGTYNS